MAEVVDLNVNGVRVTLLPTASSRAEGSPDRREATIFLALAEQAFDRREATGQVEPKLRLKGQNSPHFPSLGCTKSQRTSRKMSRNV